MADSSAVAAWMTWAFSPATSAIIVTLLISLLLPILIHYYLYIRAIPKELPTFLLLGPSGGGKTSFLTLAASGVPSATHTSQSPQTALCQLPAATRSSSDRFRSEHDTSSSLAPPKFLLIDTPGHGKLRHHALSTLAAPSALKGLLFVVDSAALSSPVGLAEAAEYLHDVLLLLQKRHTQGKTSKGPQGLPVLVLANKLDVFSSLPAGLVRRRLEEEVGRVRVTKSRALLDSGVGMEDGDAGGGSSSSAEEGNWLGEYGSNEFAFAQMEECGVLVKVIGGNVKGDGKEDGVVGEWWSWIGEQL